MEKNIIEEVIVPISPKVVPNEQLFVYVPLATVNTKGIASYNSTHFSVTNGVVSLSDAIVNRLDQLQADIPLIVDEVLSLNNSEIDNGYINSIDSGSLNKTPRVGESALVLVQTKHSGNIYTAKMTITEEKNPSGYYPFELTEVHLLHNDKEIPLILDTISLSVEYDSIDNATFFVKKDKLNKTPKLGDMAYCLLKTVDEYVYQGTVKVSSFAGEFVQFTVVEKYLIHDASVIHSIGSLRVDLRNVENTIADVEKTVPIVLTRYRDVSMTYAKLLESNTVRFPTSYVNKTPVIGDKILCLLKTEDNYVIHAVLTVESISGTVLINSIASHIVLHDGKLDDLLNGKPLELSIVSSRPEIGNVGTIYVVPATTPNTNNLYEEWIWVNDKWERFGAVSMNVNFDGYIPYDALKPINGISKMNTGEVFIYTADKGTIDNRNTDTAGWSIRLPIPPRHLDYALKIGLTTNTETLTEEEQGEACEWLGAVKKDTSLALVGNIDGRVYGIDNNGNQIIIQAAWRPVANSIAQRRNDGTLCVTNPVTGQDAANKIYVDNLFAGAVQSKTDACAFVRVYGINTKGEQEEKIVATTPSAAFNDSLTAYLAETYGDTEAGGWLVTKTPTKPYHATTMKWVEDFVGDKTTFFQHYVADVNSIKRVALINTMESIYSISDFIDYCVRNSDTIALKYLEATSSYTVLSAERTGTSTMKVYYLANDSIRSSELDLTDKPVITTKL